jgi:hypothetical protein
MRDMNTTAIVLGSDRPRCRATDGQGQRCRARVVWDNATNRPVSTRCEAHGGLADAALIRRQVPDLTDMPSKARAGTAAAKVPANSPNETA